MGDVYPTGLFGAVYRIALPYLLIDTAFIIIGANPAYLQATGRTADEIVGKHIFDAFPADPADPDSTNLDEVRASIELAIGTRQPHTSALLRYAIPRATPDGPVFEARYWSAIHTPVFDAAGQVAHVAQNAIDVTDLYRFDDATRKYYLKQDANAVPDIPHMNRPQMHEAMTRILAAERSQLQVLFDQAPGSIAVLTGRQHVVDTVNEACYALVGHRDIVGQPLLQALPELAAQGFRELLDTAIVMGDRKRLVQVLANILNNAAKYSGDGGNIVLETETEARPAHVLVHVVDDGIGMSADLATHAFDLFAQAERSSDRSAGGLGLGLALVKSLAELHGGGVTCTSPGLGKGSRFTVCLPRMAAADLRADAAPGAPAAQPNARPLRILVVDDNVDAAAMLAMLLEASGHQVAVEHGGPQALARAEAGPPEVCLLDIGLPGMDGTELAQRLRRLPGTAGAVLVAVTGYGQESDRERTRAAGFDHHLVKPLDTRELFAILEKV